jgi:hypothetical protein
VAVKQPKQEEPAPTVSVACRRKINAGIREFYSDGGELKPGRRGVNLTPSALDALISAVPQLNQQMGPAAAAVAKPAAAPAATSRKPAAASSAAAAAPAAAAGGGGSNSASGAEEVQLGGRKRAAVIDFKGRLFMDLRETYEVRATAVSGYMLPWICLARI